MTELAALEAALDRLRPVVDELASGRAEAIAALSRLAELVAAEKRRHPRISVAQRDRERLGVAAKLKVFRRSTPRGSAVSWLAACTGLPPRRIRTYLAELKAIRASGQNCGHSANQLSENV